MGGQQGVKDTKEVAVALLKLATELAVLLKDGAQLADAVELAKAVQQEPLKSALAEAVAGVANVRAEVSELDLFDGLELVKAVAAEVPALLAALKKA